MTPPIRSSLAALLAAVVCACGSPPDPSEAPQTEEEQTLYALGVRIAQFADDFALTPEELPWVRRGFTDGTLGQVLLDPNAHQKQIDALLEARIKVVAAEERRRSLAYVDTRAREPGAERGEEGWVRLTLREGDGETVRSDDLVRVRFVGKLRTGKKVDGSEGKGPDAVTALNLETTIPCWQVGLAGVRVGGRYRLTCPPDLVHGDRGLPGIIPGGSAVTYEIDVDSVERFGIAPPRDSDPGEAEEDDS